MKSWCGRIFCESIFSCEDKTYPPGYNCSAAYSAAICLPFLCPVWAWSCCQSEQWQTQTETEQPQFKYWALVLDFQLCVLRLCIQFVVVSTIRTGNVRLNLGPGVLLWSSRTMWCQTLSSLSFFRGSFFCVENKTEEKAWRCLCGLSTPSSRSCYERIRCTCKQVCRGRCKCF